MSTERLDVKSNYRLTAAEDAALLKQAGREGRTVSNLIRKLVTDYLRKQGHRL